MSNTHLESNQLGFQVLYTLRSVGRGFPRLDGQRTERLEFLEDDLGFVDLDPFSQSLEFQ